MQTGAQNIVSETTASTKLSSWNTQAELTCRLRDFPSNRFFNLGVQVGR